MDILIETLVFGTKVVGAAVFVNHLWMLKIGQAPEPGQRTRPK